MKKRLLSLLLAVCLVLPLSATLFACGGGGGSKEVTAENWQVFEQSVYTVVLEEPNSNERELVSRNGNVIYREVYHGTLGRYLYMKVDNQTYMTKTYDMGSETWGEWEVSNDIDFNTALSAELILSRLQLLGEEGFQFFEETSKDKYGTKYTLKMEMDTEFINTNMPGLLQPEEPFFPFDGKVTDMAIWYDKNAKLSRVDFTFSFNGISRHIIFDEINKVSETIVQNTVFNTMFNFTLKGAEGVDYMELYFTEDKLRLCLPNNPDPAKREAIWHYTNGEYRYYVKVGDTWKMELRTEQEYMNARTNMLKIYFTCLEEQIDKLTYNEKGGYLTEGKNTISFTQMGLTFTFKNIKLYVDTQTMQFKHGSYKIVLSNAMASVTYDFEFEMGKTEIEVPTVA